MAGFFDDLFGGAYNSQIGSGLGGLANYYLSQENIKGAQASGEQARALSEAAGAEARASSAFQPYTVTSGLANIGTTAEGGFGVNLSPQQQAMQSQLMGQSQNLFGQVGQDPMAQQQAIYEQIRATQRPEEERALLGMQEDLFSRGRGGIQTAMYGGTPEEFRYGKGLGEARNEAALAARGQALAEQRQALEGATGLLGAAYTPQQQALSLLEASQIPAGYVSRGQVTGADLGAQLSGRGIEGYIQGQDLANRLQLQQQTGLMNMLLGQQMSPLDEAKMAQIYSEIGPNSAPSRGGLFGSILDKFFGQKEEEEKTTSGNGMGSN
tara:strand:- start:142 stop:1113 length:972 start_codon:yes stop_codon:yes gene_type:complete